MPKNKARIPSPNLSPERRRRLREAIESVRNQVRQTYPDIETDDPKLWVDTLDGETDVLDTARRLGRLYLHYDAFAEATRERKPDIAAREARLRKLADASKSGVYELLEAAGLMEEGLLDTDFTATFQQARQKVREDLEPEDVPAKYIRTTKEVDRAALMSDYKSGEPGLAEFITNGGPPVLVIRSK